MTDKQLEEAAKNWVLKTGWVDGDLWLAEANDCKAAFLAGAAYQLKRMCCGECRHLVASYCVRNGDIIGDSFVPKDFGCICFEAKEGEK